MANFLYARFLQVYKYHQVKSKSASSIFSFPNMMLMLAWLLVGMLYSVSGKYLLAETEGEDAGADYQFQEKPQPLVIPEG